MFSGLEDTLRECVVQISAVRGGKGRIFQKSPTVAGPMSALWNGLDVKDNALQVGLS